MLEQMRKQGASIFVYLIFCLLIAIFVINFRPGQSRNDDGGCRGKSNVMLTVDGLDATATAFQIARSSPYNWGSKPMDKIHMALETLIRREILASEADKRGLIVTEALVMEEIKKGRFYNATPVPPASMVPPGQEEEVLALYRPIRKPIQGVFDENGLWNFKAFSAWVASLNISRNAYIEEQRRSMLASMMADLLSESVQVSREEALSQFLYEGNTASYDVVAFKPETFKTALKLTDADVDRFMKDHGDEISARYKADERTYKGTKPALKLRQIFIAKDKKPAGMAIDEAKAKLEAVRTAAATDKAKFTAAAKDLNTDETAKSLAGDIGWHTTDNAALGDKVLNDAVKALKPGDLTPVIATDRGAFLILAEDKREGDLSFDQVKRELAWELAKDVWSKEAAKRAALAALDVAKGKNLDSLYDKDEPEASPGGITPEQLEQILQNPNTPEATKAQIRSLLQRGMGPHGALEVPPAKDIPAGWFETQESAGSAAPTPVMPPALPAIPAADLTPSKDVLPALDAPKLHVSRFGPNPRAKQVSGLGQSKEAITAVFEELAPGELAKRVYEAEGSYLVVQLVARQQPNVSEFDKDADRRVATMRTARAAEFLDSWLRDRCQALVKANRIKPNADLLIEHDEQGKVLPVSYRPCMTF
jgi:parvulin-like peptidyl-prolyl isomerase